jgi:hypothetical protein
MAKVMKPICVPVKHAAAMIGVRPYWIVKALREKTLVARQIGVKSLISVADLERWFANLPPTPHKKRSRHADNL